MARASTVTILTILGATIFFGAWVLQNYVYPDLESRVTDLKINQSLIQVERLNREMWQIEYNQELTLADRNSRVEGERERKIQVAYNYLDAVQNIFFWESYRGAAPKVKEGLPVSKEIVGRRRDALFQAGDLEGLVELVGHYDGLLSEKQRELDGQFSREYQQVKSQVATAKIGFPLAYALGSILLAVRWVLTALFGWPSNLGEMWRGRQRVDKGRGN